MVWIIAGLVYSVGYAALTAATVVSGGLVPLDSHARLILGNVGLLVPPLATIAVVIRRRDAWTGTQRVFWMAVGAGAALWLVGQLGWALDEVFHARLLPWFRWHLLLQLCASVLPLIALAAWPHRGPRTESAATAGLDILLLACLTIFLYWSLIIAPGLSPTLSAPALQALAIAGPFVRAIGAMGLLWAATLTPNPWSLVYKRMAWGMALAFPILVFVSVAVVGGSYQTGSPADIGWMLPFWFSAWAAAEAPASGPEPRRSLALSPSSDEPKLLLTAILLVPIVGYGARYLMPVGDPIDYYRGLATALTMTVAAILAMIRLSVERRAVQRADERVRLLAAACEQAGDAILMISTRGLEYANDAACRTFGYSRGELQGLQPLVLLTPDSRAAAAEIGETVRAGHVSHVTLALVRKDATTFRASCVVTPLVDADGRVTHIVSAIRDLTDDLRVREQLVRAERMSAIGEVVSGIANEINNPLQSVIGTTEVLLGTVRESSIRGDLDRVHREAARAARIIRNLLIFVRKAPRERVLIDLNETVHATVAQCAYELRSVSLDVREEYAASLPLVLADRGEIQQAVLNLLVNAQQSVAQAGRGGILTVRTFLGGHDAVIEVADDGPGVPAALAGRIFEPSFTTRNVTDGTGLGLSVAFGIATAHGGTLELVPRPERADGACFRLTLPGAGFPGPAHAA